MHEAIGCGEAVRRLWDFLEDDLAVADHRAVEQHLAWCMRCCGELAFARELQQVLRTRTGGELPGDVRRRLEQVVDELCVPTTEGEVAP